MIRHLHQNMEDERAAVAAGGSGPAPEPFDTVRGMFPEGDPAYDGAGFLARTHTQIAVRTESCIKGVFRLR